MVKIEQWSVGTHKLNEFLAPECQTLHLSGKVYGYPGRPDGQRITTSEIKSVKGRVVRCLSREYVLGEPAPEYIEWCKEHGCHVPTEEVPIKI